MSTKIELSVYLLIYYNSSSLTWHQPLLKLCLALASVSQHQKEQTEKRRQMKKKDKHLVEKGNRSWYQNKVDRKTEACSIHHI